MYTIKLKPLSGLSSIYGNEKHPLLEFDKMKKQCIHNKFVIQYVSFKRLVSCTSCNLVIS